MMVKLFGREDKKNVIQGDAEMIREEEVRTGRAAEPVEELPDIFKLFKEE